VCIAGPTTLAAILSSIRMGFRTLAIQKRSTEVWAVLAGVKTEFTKFGDAVKKVSKKLQEASNAVDSVSTRTRQMERKLRSVEALPVAEGELPVLISELAEETEQLA
jgi:DNA recombination protein RmuC